MKVKGKSSSQGAEAAKRHWKFYRSGGVDQVQLKEGADIAELRQLDLKLWMALAMPTSGIAFDSRTAELIDTDGDGRIRPKELLEAVDWICDALVDPGLLMTPGDSVPLAAIKNKSLAASAQLLLANLGKANASGVCVADVLDRKRIFAGTLFNGDGVVTPEAAEDEATRKAMEEVICVMGAVTDRSGKPGLDRERLEGFFAQAATYADWAGRPEREPALAPLGPGPTATAAEALAAVRAKVEDFFTRCRLAAFEPRAAAVVNRDEAEYRAIAAMELAPASAAVAALPLARASAEGSLPLSGPVNPAWAGALAAFAEQAARPLAGAGAALSEPDWRGILARLEGYLAWKDAEPRLPVAALGEARVRELLAGEARPRIAALIDRDAALEANSARIESIERLVRYRRDLFRLLSNYVNFSDFYGRAGAVFQSGTLYLDARACSLCVDVADESKHAALAALAGAFLVYCDLSRPGGARRKIVAAVTDGDSDNLMVGRNGVFYDREGLDWDATVTRVISNPISVREAFWLPYKKFSRMIEEQVAKRASAGESASTAKLSTAASTLANADQAAPAAAKPEAPAKKLDLGTIALIGTAIGGISALVASFFQTLFGLGLWLPVGLLGIVLLISGPSMILASLKLRKRNLGPILDANGWAINTQARINIPFGAALTVTAALPPGSIPSIVDPFAEKRRPWGLLLVLALAALAAAALALWYFGLLDGILPEALGRAAR